MRVAALRRPSVRVAIVVACVAALLWTLRSLEPGRVWRAAAGADAPWLWLSALPVLARFLIWGVKWKRILGRREPVGYLLGLRILAAGSFVNLTTPTAKLAGGVVRAGLLRRRCGWPLLEAYGRAMSDQVTNVLGHVALFGLVGVAAWWSLPPGRLRTGLVASGAGVLAGLALLVAMRDWGWRAVRRPEVGRLLARLIPGRLRGGETAESFREHLGRVLHPLLHEGGRLTVLLPDLAWAAASFAALCLANAMVLRALGVELPLVLASAVVLIGYFAGVAVGIAGGIGVTEAALTGLYVQLGVSAETAVAAALLHRAIFYAIALALGGGALLWETGRARRRGTLGSGR